MQNPPTSPWHKTSFDHFLRRSLPDLLTDRLGLSGYSAESAGQYACRVTLQLRGRDHDLEVVFAGLPAPDEAGVFRLAWPAGDDSRPTNPAGRGEPRSWGDDAPPTEPVYAAAGTELVVLPMADRDDLAEARIACVGEQLLQFVEARLGRVPEGVELDETLVRALVPLEAWFRAFLAQSGQPLDNTNSLARATHLRRLLVPDRQVVFTTGHFGRTCPFETPEGPNIGRVLTISRGAAVQDGRLVIVDDTPVAGLGLSAASVPFLEHDDGNRLLTGVNMMRQWLPPAEPEPAWVQTGLEPDVSGFWCGRNLLTAFTSWDGDAFEDALVVGESAARKLACPEPLEPGDKLSNRHGTKGVVSRVVPDAQMPRLPDGTAVELVFSFSGVPSRWTLGQLREAALGRVARIEGRPALVPPFAAPSDEQLQERLRQAGLPESGLVTLTDGGAPLQRPCAAGWVYWGCTIHRARTKLRAVTGPGQGGQRLGRMEVQALREAGAEIILVELTNTCSEEREDAATLADRVAAGTVGPASTPSPRFAAVAARLARAGIRAEVGAAGIAFALAPPPTSGLELAEAVPHPWLPAEQVRQALIAEGEDGYQPIAEANARLARLLASLAPGALVDEARQTLARAVAALYDGLLSPADLTFGTRALFSGRTVIVPGPDLATDQLGLPAEMAWALYGPQVTAELGDPQAVAQRTDAAATALTGVMASSWIVLNRAPSVGPTSLLAFRPVLCHHRALRLHPLACRLLNADFDGDQAAVFLPLTARAQEEAGAKLSIAGHLARDPDLVKELFPPMDALFGLACLSRSGEGRQAIAAAAGRHPELTGGILTREGVVELLRARLASHGPAAALGTAEELMRLGFTAARREGGSLGPFVGATLPLPEAPAGEDPDQWQAYQEEVYALVAGFREYDDQDLGAVCLLSHCGARGSTAQIAALFTPGGLVRDLEGRLVPVRGCWRGGLSPAEVLARVVGARRALHAIQSQFSALGEEHESRARPDGHGVLCRARRSARPGVVLARAAARAEVDPLTDEYSRLFVGLPAGQA